MSVKPLATQHPAGEIELAAGERKHISVTLLGVRPGDNVSVNHTSVTALLGDNVLHLRGEPLDHDSVTVSLHNIAPTKITLPAGKLNVVAFQIVAGDEDEEASASAEAESATTGAAPAGDATAGGAGGEGAAGDLDLVGAAESGAVDTPQT